MAKHYYREGVLFPDIASLITKSVALTIWISVALLYIKNFMP